MNLYQINSEVDKYVINNAEFDIRRYTDFINKSIEFLKRETFSIRITKKIVEFEIEKEGKKITRKETGYFPEFPKSKSSEKAIDILFNENTKEIFDQKKHFSKEHSIRITDKNEVENYFLTNSEINGNEIFLKPDTYQLEQQKKALDILRFKPLKEHKPILNLFGHPDNKFWEQGITRKDITWQILTDETRDGVFEQREFVSKAIQTNDFALMEGPPGSGKTTTIIELILQYTSEGKRVLLCSATHAAIDNVIERITGRYKNVCEKEIVPIRISRFDKPVKESVRPFLLKNVADTYLKKIEKQLRKDQTLESQKFLLNNLHRKEENNTSTIEKLILDSANLVAGTMIGILQHPDIKAIKSGASFDVLIVDEASKVTFSDFIVPALHAKKWVLVGDVKQLSPYVENDFVSENISTILDEKIQKTIVDLFELKVKLDDIRYQNHLKVYFTDLDPEKEKRYIDKKDLVIETIDEHWEANEMNVSRLNSADLVIAKNNNKIRQLLANNIYVKSIFINGETTGLQQQFRQGYLRSLSGKPQERFLFDSRQEEWSEMVSSRLNQSFSFRNAKGFENIELELRYLIPKEIREDIDRIKRLVFPSILELLQNGIGKGEGQRNNRVLSDGFHENFKKSRFVALSFQHRMHPDIAKTSMENFYPDSLKPANTVLHDRNWNYAKNEPAVKWIFNNSDSGNRKGEKIINIKEAEHIEYELLKFLEWAKNNPKSDGENYEVALLTFYLNQESELRSRIRKITGQQRFSKFEMNNTDIYLYTVDKFQGQEADMVLLGFTKFTRDAHFNSPNRLNVALTRARHKLIIFGNRSWFRERAKLKALRDLAENFDSTIRLDQ